MKVKVNKEKCIICGMCASIEPEVFKFEASGEVEVDNKNINEENKDNVEKAKNSCPVGAIEEIKEEENQD